MEGIEDGVLESISFPLGIWPIAFVGNIDPLLGIEDGMDDSTTVGVTDWAATGGVVSGSGPSDGRCDGCSLPKGAKEGPREGSVDDLSDGVGASVDAGGELGLGVRMMGGCDSVHPGLVSDASKH
jgi:hypothetical protein